MYNGVPPTKRRGRPPEGLGKKAAAGTERIRGTHSPREESVRVHDAEGTHSPREEGPRLRPRSTRTERREARMGGNVEDSIVSA